MSVTYRPFVPDVRHQTFLDSQALMATNFTDPTGTSAEFLEWLYLRNPFGKAVGFLAYDGEVPVSQLFLIFQQAIFDKALFTVAVASNACTVKSHRGQGHFYKIFTLLVEEARKMEVPFIWAYPNPHSMRGFMKTGFHVIKECSLELAPVSYWGVVRELWSKEAFSIDARTEDVPVNLDSTSRFSVVTTSLELDLTESEEVGMKDCAWRIPLTREQLMWRYFKHPTRNYVALLHKNSGTIVVLRFIRLFGLVTGLIMKSNAGTSASYNRLLKDLRADLRGKVSFLTTLPSQFTKPGIGSILHERFSIPHQLSPRKFPLVVYPIRESLPLGSPESFDFVLGDYEAL